MVKYVVLMFGAGVGLAGGLAEAIQWVRRRRRRRGARRKQPWDVASAVVVWVIVMVFLGWGLW